MRTGKKTKIVDIKTKEEVKVPEHRVNVVELLVNGQQKLFSIVLSSKDRDTVMSARDEFTKLSDVINFLMKLGMSCPNSGENPCGPDCPYCHGTQVVIPKIIEAVIVGNDNNSKEA